MKNPPQSTVSQSGLTYKRFAREPEGKAIGLERAGFEALAHVEFDRHACETLRLNRPDWNVVEGDVRDFSAKEFKGVDLLAGGVPCPALLESRKTSSAPTTSATFSPKPSAWWTNAAPKPSCWRMSAASWMPCSPITG